MQPLLNYFVGMGFARLHTVNAMCNDILWLYHLHLLHRVEYLSARCVKVNHPRAGIIPWGVFMNTTKRGQICQKELATAKRPVVARGTRS